MYRKGGLAVEVRLRTYAAVAMANGAASCQRGNNDLDAREARREGSTG